MLKEKHNIYLCGRKNLYDNIYILADEHFLNVDIRIIFNFSVVVAYNICILIVCVIFYDTNDYFWYQKENISSMSILLFISIYQ